MPVITNISTFKLYYEELLPPKLVGRVSPLHRETSIGTWQSPLIALAGLLGLKLAVLAWRTLQLPGLRFL